MRLGRELCRKTQRTDSGFMHQADQKKPESAENRK